MSYGHSQDYRKVGLFDDFLNADLDAEEAKRCVPTAIRQTPESPAKPDPRNAPATIPAAVRGAQNARVPKETMMANEVAVPPEKQQELSQRSTTLASRLADLRSMPVSQVTATCAQELIQDAKRYMDAVHDVFDPLVNAAFTAHRQATALRNKFLRPGSDADMAARSRVQEYDIERRRRIEAEKREAERLAQLKAEQDRLEELAHLQAQNVPTEIIEQRAADPIIMAAPDVDESRGKVAGASTVDRWTGEVTDMGAFLTYIASVPGLWHLVSVETTALSRVLTSAKGQPLPGVKIVYNPIIRSKAS